MPIILAGGGPPSPFDFGPLRDRLDAARAASEPAKQNPSGSDPSPAIAGPPSQGYSTILRNPPIPAATTQAKDDVI